MLFFIKDSPIFLLSINVNWLFLFFLSNLNFSNIFVVVIEMFFISFNEVGSVNFFNRQYLSGTNDITQLNEQKNTSTTIKWTHKQELRNNQSFNANATYSTNGDYNKKYGLSERERMDQKAISNISYSKRWPKSKNSFSTNFYSNLDLLIDEKTDSSSNYYIKFQKINTINLKNSVFFNN